MKTYTYLSLAACMILGMTACALSPEPYDYQPDNELKPGPGLFSGEDGEFTILRIPKAGDQENDSALRKQKGEEKNESH